MSNELIIIEESTALQVFSSDNGLDPIINQARDAVAGFDHDLSTAAGRKRTASLANKVAKLKTRLDGMGKGLVSDWKKQAKAVDQNRKLMRDELDDLKAEARKPLSLWEDEQKAIEASKAFELMVDDAHKINNEFNESKANEKLIDHMQAIIDNHQHDECIKAKAEQQRLHELKIAEDAAAEAKLKAEQEAVNEQNRLKAEKQVAIDAQAKAEKDAEDQRQAVIQRQIDLENSEIKAEINRLQSIEDAKLLAEKNEADRLAREKQAKIDSDNAAKAAVAEEKRKVEEQAAKDLEAKQLREANQKHVTKIKTEIKSQFIAAGLTEEQAIIATRAIVKTDFKHVTVTY